MPGSPPISTTDPTTRPPPSTRSNSSLPVPRRAIDSVATEPSVCTPAVGARLAKRLRLPARSSATDSCKVFQAVQWGHWPDHFGEMPAQSVQTYWVLALAMDSRQCLRVQSSTSTATRGAIAHISS